MKTYKLCMVYPQNITIEESDNNLELEAQLENMLLNFNVFEIKHGDKFEVINNTTGETVYKSEY